MTEGMRKREKEREAWELKLVAQVDHKIKL